MPELPLIVVAAFIAVLVVGAGMMLRRDHPGVVSEPPTLNTRGPDPTDPAGGSH
jgi:hypothetical protein